VDYHNHFGQNLCQMMIREPESFTNQTPVFRLFFIKGIEKMLFSMADVREKLLPELII